MSMLIRWAVSGTNLSFAPALGTAAVLGAIWNLSNSCATKKELKELEYKFDKKLDGLTLKTHQNIDRLNQNIDSLSLAVDGLKNPLLTGSKQDQVMSIQEAFYWRRRVQVLEEQLRSVQKPLD